jgi:hypothetical protein
MAIDLFAYGVANWRDKLKGSRNLKTVISTPYKKIYSLEDYQKVWTTPVTALIEWWKKQFGTEDMSKLPRFEFVSNKDMRQKAEKESVSCRCSPVLKGYLANVYQSGF